MNYQTDFIWSALKMLISLGILLGILVAGLYLAKRLFRRTEMGTAGSMIRVLANTYVGVKKNISLVEVPGAILVLGITGDSINLLAKIEDEETLERLKRPGHEKGRGSFLSHLQGFSTRQKGRE